ncbi:hypothetical protein ACHAXT_008332 [Thalassiosira profunda]
MAASFLTPKPTHDARALPPCPPAPRPLHQAAPNADAPAFPAVLLFSASLFDDGPSSDAENDATCTIVSTKAPPPKRRRVDTSRPIPKINLKPRPSKFVAPPPRRRLSLTRSNSKLALLQARTAGRNSLTRTSSKTGLHALARSPSYQMLVRAGMRPGLPRRPSFSSRAA